MILNGKGQDLLKGLKGEVDLIVTSPPYDNLRKTGFTIKEAHEMIAYSQQALKCGGTLVWVISDSHTNGEDSLSSFKHAEFMQHAGLKVNVQIYRILNPKPNAQRRTPTKDFEYIFVGHKGNPKATRWIEVPSKHAGKSTGGSNGRKQGYEKAELRTIGETKRHSTTWEYSVGSAYGTNATPFPLQLARDFITMYSNFGDLVVDPMCGSGTTGVAAYIENRLFKGADINPERVTETIQNIADAMSGLW
jgi:site-specific DNA-methyltransferase (adenine-specific)